MASVEKPVEIQKEGEQQQVNDDESQVQPQTSTEIEVGENAKEKKGSEVVILPHR